MTFIPFKIPLTKLSFIFLQKHDKQFTIIQLIKILKNITAKIRYLTNIKYVHKNLTTRNILINNNLIYKISNFNLSRIIKNNPETIYTTTINKHLLIYSLYLNYPKHTKIT